MIKDDHTFSVHLVDPKSESVENKGSIALDPNMSASNLDIKSYMEGSSEEKSSVAKYIAFTGVMKDGMTLSISNHSLTPKCKLIKKITHSWKKYQNVRWKSIKFYRFSSINDMNEIHFFNCVHLRLSAKR